MAMLHQHGTVGQHSTVRNHADAACLLPAARPAGSWPEVLRRWIMLQAQEKLAAPQGRAAMLPTGTEA